MSNIHTPLSETKHLGAGSTCPALKPQVLRVYSMKFCPFAERARLILAAKKISHEVVNINLQTKPEWYLVKNPLGLVPCIEFDRGVVYDSLIVADYLDDIYPSPPLNNKDPFLRAKDRIIVELFNKVSSNLFALYGSVSNPEVGKEKLKNVEDGLLVCEKELKTRSSPFFGGTKPGMLDYLIWPFLERAPAIPLLSNNTLCIDENKFPTLMTWCNAMKEDSAVKSVYIPPEKHAKFIAGFNVGKPDFDMEL